MSTGFAAPAATPTGCEEVDDDAFAELAWPGRKGRGAADPLNMVLNYGYGVLYGEVGSGKAKRFGRNLERLAEVLERSGFEFCREPVNEAFQGFVVFHGKLDGPARPALFVGTDAEAVDTDDARRAPGASSLLVDPGLVIAE